VSAFPFADVSLARRLERAEALSNARFVDSRARVAPASDACWIEVAGTYAMFDGPASPATQTFGLGMFAPPAPGDLDRLEAFFMQRGAPVYHEVSPLADEGVVPLLTARGYRPFEFTSVLYQPIEPAGLKACPTEVPDATAGLTARTTTEPDVVQAFRPAAVTARAIEPGEEELYARTSAAGWAESGLGDFILEIARANAASEGVTLFLAEAGGAAIAAAALSIVDGVAHLAGASTIPAGRRRGAQLALLAARLRYAASRGCDVALMGALPGSGSQRNAERNGFRIAYTRIKWRRT
jgi:hypothetical protein